MPHQTQENHNWFARESKSGLLAPWGAPQISPWERCNHRKHAEAKLILWAGGWTQTIFRFSLQMVSLSEKHMWLELLAGVKGTTVLQFQTTKTKSGCSQVTSTRSAIAGVYFLTAESQYWWHTGLKGGISLWLQEGGQSYINIKWILDITVLRLKYIKRMWQKVSLAHMAHLLFSCTKNLVIAGFYNN